MIDDDQTYKEFRDAVNMTRGELERWLASDESQSVGIDSGGNKKTGASGGESVGHDSGRKIAAIPDKRKADLADGDYAHMRKVVGYVNRHLAQKPKRSRSRIRGGAIP